jgi:hypothetical protein
MNKHNFKENKKLDKSTSTLPHNTHPQAITTSRILNFKNLPEPKNADDCLSFNSSKSKKTSYKTVKDLEPGCT